MNNDKPKIGILGLIFGAYEPIFPGITARQEVYVHEIISDLGDSADFHFPGAVANQQGVIDVVRKFNETAMDGIMIVLLSYSLGLSIVKALQQNKLPILLACIQPEQTIGNDWEEFDLTVNQGIHGSQDNANTIMRMGLPCEVVVENRKSVNFKTRIIDWAKASQTVCSLRKMKIALLGRLPGMGDILSDDWSFHAKIGPEVLHENAGVIYQFMHSLTQSEISNQIERDRDTFEIDPALSFESLETAAKMYLAFKKLLESKEYSAYTAHFDIFQEDGRFNQLPFLAASNLMADGYGYAAEGDTATAAMVAASFCLTGNANFSEMYAMDFEQNEILLCHAGEGNWLTARNDRKPKLIDRTIGEGGLGNPPTPVFTPEPGPAALISLSCVKGDQYRLIVSKGEILNKSDMKKIDMPYMFFRPIHGVRNTIESWLKNGGTHHEVVNLGDYTSRWKILCNILGVEYCEV